MPRYYDVFVPLSRRHEGMEETWPCELKNTVDSVNVDAGVVEKEEERGEAGVLELSPTKKSLEYDPDERRFDGTR